MFYALFWSFVSAGRNTGTYALNNQDRMRTYLLTCAPNDDSDRTVLSDYSLDVFWIAEVVRFLYTDNED